MAKEKLGTGEILSTFFDDGVYTPLLASGAVEAAHGCAGGQPVYAVCQNGGALTVKDVEKQIKALEMACLTGNPVVTFYDAAGAKLDEGLDVLTAASRLNAACLLYTSGVAQLCADQGVGRLVHGDGHQHDQRPQQPHQKRSFKMCIRDSPLSVVAGRFSPRRN